MDSSILALEQLCVCSKHTRFKELESKSSNVKVDLHSTFNDKNSVISKKLDSSTTQNLNNSLQNSTKSVATLYEYAKDSRIFLKKLHFVGCQIQGKSAQSKRSSKASLLKKPRHKLAALIAQT